MEIKIEQRKNGLIDINLGNILMGAAIPIKWSVPSWERASIPTKYSLVNNQGEKRDHVPQSDGISGNVGLFLEETGDFFSLPAYKTEVRVVTPRYNTVAGTFQGANNTTKVPARFEWAPEKEEGGFSVRYY